MSDKGKRGVPLRDWAAPTYGTDGRSVSTNGGSGAGTCKGVTQIPSISGRDKHDSGTFDSGHMHKTSSMPHNKK